MHAEPASTDDAITSAAGGAEGADGRLRRRPNEKTAVTSASSSLLTCWVHSTGISNEHDNSFTPTQTNPSTARRGSGDRFGKKGTTTLTHTQPPPSSTERIASTSEASTHEGCFSPPRSPAARSKPSTPPLGWRRPSREMIDRATAHLLSLDLSSIGGGGGAHASLHLHATPPSHPHSIYSGGYAGGGASLTSAPFLDSIPTEDTEAAAQQQQQLWDRSLSSPPMCPEGRRRSGQDAGGPGLLQPQRDPASSAHRRPLARQSFLSVGNEERRLPVDIAAVTVPAPPEPSPTAHYRDTASPTSPFTATQVPPLAGMSRVMAATSQVMHQHHADRLAGRYFHKLWRFLMAAKSAASRAPVSSLPVSQQQSRLSSRAFCPAEEPDLSAGGEGVDRLFAVDSPQSRSREEGRRPSSRRSGSDADAFLDAIEDGSLAPPRPSGVRLPIAAAGAQSVGIRTAAAAAAETSAARESGEDSTWTAAQLDDSQEPSILFVAQPLPHPQPHQLQEPQLKGNTSDAVESGSVSDDKQHRLPQWSYLSERASRSDSAVAARRPPVLHAPSLNLPSNRSGSPNTPQAAESAAGGSHSHSHGLGNSLSQSSHPALRGQQQQQQSMLSSSKAAFTVTPVFAPQTHYPRECSSTTTAATETSHSLAPPPEPELAIALVDTADAAASGLDTPLAQSATSTKRQQRSPQPPPGSARRVAALAGKLLERLSKTPAPADAHARSASDPDGLRQPLIGRPRPSPLSPSSRQAPELVSPQRSREGEGSSHGDALLRSSHDAEGIEVGGAGSHRGGGAEDVWQSRRPQWKADYQNIMTSQVSHRVLLQRREHRRRAWLADQLANTMDMLIMAALRPSLRAQAQREVAAAMRATPPAYDTDDSLEQKAKARTADEAGKEAADCPAARNAAAQWEKTESPTKGVDRDRRGRDSDTSSSSTEASSRFLGDDGASLDREGVGNPFLNASDSDDAADDGNKASEEEPRRLHREVTAPHPDPRPHHHDALAEDRTCPSDPATAVGSGNSSTSQHQPPRASGASVAVPLTRASLLAAMAAAAEAHPQGQHWQESSNSRSPGRLLSSPRQSDPLTPSQHPRQAFFSSSNLRRSAREIQERIARVRADHEQRRKRAAELLSGASTSTTTARSDNVDGEGRPRGMRYHPPAAFSVSAVHEDDPSDGRSGQGGEGQDVVVTAASTTAPAGGEAAAALVSHSSLPQVLTPAGRSAAASSTSPSHSGGWREVAGGPGSGPHLHAAATVAVVRRGNEREEEDAEGVIDSPEHVEQCAGSLTSSARPSLNATRTTAFMANSMTLAEGGGGGSSSSSSRGGGSPDTGDVASAAPQ